MDNLERYIKEHREEFDTEITPPMVWSAVSAELDQHNQKRYTWRHLTKVAAASVAVLTVGLLIGLRLGGQSDLPASTSLQEFAQAEDFYSKEIRVRWSEFEAMDAQEAGAVQEDLEQLDAIYQELKGELLQHPELNTQMVVDALIDNYRNKLELLETVLEKTKKQNLSTLNLEDHELDEI